MRKQPLSHARSMGAACCLVFACGDSVSPGGVTASLEATPLQQSLRGEHVTEPHLVKTRGPAHQPEDGRPSSSSHDRDGHDRDGHDHDRHDGDGHPHGHEPEEPSSSACGEPLWLEEIAADDSDWHIGAAPPALDNAGSLAFAAADAAGDPHLLLVREGVFTAVELGSSGLTLPSRVGLDDAGNLAFVAATPSSDGLFGVFSTDAEGSSVAVHYAAEEGGGLGDEGSLITGRPFALAPNGTLAFSSIRNGRGALYRGDVTGDLEVVRTGSGAFFNQQEMDVNAAGTVALQMEHNMCGLQRGVLLFDEPGIEIADVTKAIAGLSVGSQPDVALNDAGVIAFAIPGGARSVPVLRCPEGEPLERFDVSNGVYTASPTPISDRPDLQLIADNAGAFASFGSVDIDAEGRVVFEGVLASGERGIFAGPDAELDKIVAVGDELNGEVVTEVQLGQLNDACQLSFATVSASGRRVWRADGIAR